MKHPATPAGESTAVRARPPVWPWPPSARRYSGDLAVDFFSSGYLDVSVPRVVLPGAMSSPPGCAACRRAGSPIRRPAGRRVCAPNRGLSQLAASFVGFLCQGIRRAPMLSSLVSHTFRGRSRAPAIRCLLLPYIVNLMSICG